MIKTIKLKDVAHVEASISILQMEIENARKEGVSLLKLVHGYGSHGSGGAILKAVREELLICKKRGQIKNFFNGDKWNLFDKETLKLLQKDKTVAGDEDLNKNNPGITVVVI